MSASVAEIGLGIITDFALENMTVQTLIEDLHGLDVAYAEKNNVDAERAFNGGFDVGRRSMQECIANLQARIAELEKELASRPAVKPTISIVSADLFKEAVEPNKNHNFINYVKWLRNEAVKMSTGELIGLYEAKLIAEAVFAMYRFKKCTIPTRGEKAAYNNEFCNRAAVMAYIVSLLEFKYPGYDISVSDPYDCF